MGVPFVGMGSSFPIFQEGTPFFNTVLAAALPRYAPSNVWRRK
jgi:hypothetical protein